MILALPKREVGSKIGNPF